MAETERVLMDLLVEFGFVDRPALDDPEGYDAGITLLNVSAFYKAVNARLIAALEAEKADQEKRLAFFWDAQKCAIDDYAALKAEKAAAVLAEREACAKVAIKISDACTFKKLSDGYWAGVEIRDAIRSRSAADNGVQK